MQQVFSPLTRPEVKLLPKTPSSKKTIQALRRKKKQETILEEDDEDSDVETIKPVKKKK